MFFFHPDFLNRFLLAVCCPCLGSAEKKWRNIHSISTDWKSFFLFSSVTESAVCTAKGSKGSCLYKTEGAQINRRENWVSLEPLAKTNLSMMESNTNLQIPHTALTISKLHDCFAALFPLIQILSAFILLLRISVCLQTVQN